MDDLKTWIEWAKGLTGLVTTVLMVFLGGKMWRANRVDSARTDVQVAELNGEKADAQRNTETLARLEQKLQEQSTKIDNLTTKVTQLEADVRDLLNTNISSVQLLEEIDLRKPELASANEAFLRTAIKQLKNAHAAHG